MSAVSTNEDRIAQLESEVLASLAKAGCVAHVLAVAARNESEDDFRPGDIEMVAETIAQLLSDIGEKVEEICGAWRAAVQESEVSHG